MDHIYIGIDPGASGGIAGIDEHGKPIAYWVLKNLNHHQIHQALWYYRDLPAQESAMIEKVHAMPKQGVSSTFKFGVSYGVLLSALAAKPAIIYDTVTPHKWQQALCCLSKGDKNVTKARAQAFFPTITMTHAIADAFLIAEYARRFGPWCVQSHINEDL